MIFFLYNYENDKNLYIVIAIINYYRTDFNSMNFREYTDFVNNQEYKFSYKRHFVIIF